MICRLRRVTAGPNLPRSLVFFPRSPFFAISLAFDRPKHRTIRLIHGCHLDDRARHFVAGLLTTIAEDAA
jgi:hypothetical protein